MPGQKLLMNVLFKRGAKAAEESLGKAVRHGMTMAGGALMQNGLADASDVQALSGGAVALAGIALSLARIWAQKKLG